jgi:hypothetical protein
LLEDDNDEITLKFCTANVDTILDERTRTGVVEGAKNASWLNSKSRFSAGGGLGMDNPFSGRLL